MRFKKETGSFQAKTDSGEVHTVIEYQEYISVLTGAGTITETEGAKRWETSNGLVLRQLDSRTYRIVSNDEILRKI
jgi:uncharacterized cupin superfamily protein